jgi:putative DNA methylase
MRKKMIEVAIPLDAINRESAREKSIRHGHPSTLHLWWARRPLAACRAVLFTSLVDDPESDPANLNADGSLNSTQVEQRRKELFGVVEELVRWESSIDASVIRRARAEIASSIASAKVFDGKEWQQTKAICGCTVKAFLDRTAPPDAVDKFLAENAPTILDPFAGGGSIPLEAQRLGLRVLARDLNPVPVLINRALVEVPPRFANCPPVNPDRDTGGRSSKKTSINKSIRQGKTTVD